MITCAGIVQRLSRRNICSSFSSIQGFLRVGSGLQVDQLDEYLEKTLVEKTEISEMEAVTNSYLTALAANDRSAISQYAKKPLAEKTSNWLEQLKKNGEQLTLVSEQSPLSSSLQCFTNFSHMYGIKWSVQQKAEEESVVKFEEVKSIDFNPNFLLKRIFYWQGWRYHETLKNEQTVAEAIVYVDRKLEVVQSAAAQSLEKKKKKIGNNSYASTFNHENSYVALKIVFVREKARREKGKDDKWILADINDWVYTDLQKTKFTKWAFQAVTNQSD